MNNPNEPNNPTSTSQRPVENHETKNRNSLRLPSQLLLQELRTIVELHQQGYGTRQIARRVCHDRKTVRRVLLQKGLLKPILTPPSPNKLDPFRELIRQKVDRNLTLTRILREIREAGYSGGRTILSAYVRSIRSPLVPSRSAKRRFETGPAEELQVDWSLYTVPIACEPVRVHALSCVLAYSRKAHVRFYRDERESTLLEGLTLAFEAFGGVALRAVFDNMSTVVLGRIGPNHKPLWHPRFLDFARYYGFEPFACKVRDPDRKGKTERFFDYLEKDFVRGAEFSSFEDLNQRVQHWIDQIANRRIHGTTRMVPNEAWQIERDFLICLPDTRFGVYQEEIRQVGPDATISVLGTLYVVPATLARQSVPVHLFAEHFEVLNRNGTVVFSRAYVDDKDKGKLQLDPNQYATLPNRPPDSPSTRIDEAFLKRFPMLAPLVDGIARRMKSLAHVHLRTLWRLADLYGEEIFLGAAIRAQDYRRFNAEAVRRILERTHPLPEKPLEIVPLGAAARALTILGEVDPGSLANYDHLDTCGTLTGHEESGSGTGPDVTSPPEQYHDDKEGSHDA
jgi:transposase